MRATCLGIAATILFSVTTASASTAPVCGDVNINGEVTTSDALAVLRKSVGQDLLLQCEACPAGNTYGNTTDFVTPVQYFSGYLQGSAHQIPVESTVSHLGVIARSSGQRARLALYTDNAGEPDQLVVGTGVFTLVEGAQLVQVPASLVPAGTYWIMSTFDDTVLVATDETNTGTTFKYRSLTFSSQLPEQFGETMFYSGSRQNYYLQVAAVIP
jgi:hypothetical protein